jgi:hypothetical protein
VGRLYPSERHTRLIPHSTTTTTTVEAWAALLRSRIVTDTDRTLYWDGKSHLAHLPTIRSQQ